MMEIVKNVAAVVGCVSACIALLMTIFKPIRQSVINFFANKSERQTLLDDVRYIKNSLNETIVKQDEAIAKLDRVEKNVLLNESDRLKTELFDCGNRCRRHIPLHPEEFGHIRDVYDKYSNVLHQNHDGTNEWEFIFDYYNHQDLTK